MRLLSGVQGRGVHVGNVVQPPGPARMQMTRSWHLGEDGVWPRQCLSLSLPLSPHLPLLRLFSPSGRSSATIPPPVHPKLLPMHAMRPATPLLRAAIRSAAPRAQHIPAPASKRLFCTPRTSTATRPSPILSRARAPCSVRCESTAASPQAPESRLERDQVPSYELTFTCNVCKTRSSHRLSKQGYHKGTVLISCPDCKNRHLISDHLKVSREWHGVRSHF